MEAKTRILLWNQNFTNAPDYTSLFVDDVLDL
jgi:hypothetical protein